MIRPELIWFIAGLVLILLEFALPGVIIVFFGLGAWITFITTYLKITGSAASQLMVFAASSVILLILLRRYITSRFSGFVSERQIPDKNLDEFTGKPAVVLSEITSAMPGKVEFKGAPWEATSVDSFEKGEIGIIEKVDGLTLIIRKKEIEK